MDNVPEPGSLSDRAAIVALSKVASSWLASRTPEATRSLLVTTLAQGTSSSGIPGWALDPEESEQEAGTCARVALAAILEGTDDEAAAWARAAVRQASDAVAHLLDPVSLGIMGGILIGSILAARVKRIGGVEFYEGVPRELADVLKAGVGSGSS